MNTIYTPKGKALEYGEYALNIFDGCVHGCLYCYAPLVLKKDRSEFHKSVRPRANIVEETYKFLSKHTEMKGKHIFLCFTNDPFPFGYNELHSITYKIIDIIHESGNYVQILTKGCPSNKIYAHLTPNDIFGITASCGYPKSNVIEPNAAPISDRLEILKNIKQVIKCNTFVSCEPVIEPSSIYDLIINCNFIDKYKIGKLNYAKPSDYGMPNINWKVFGNECERLCEKYNRNYYIKESLQSEMNN